jgi:hypothetical protein
MRRQHVKLRRIHAVVDEMENEIVVRVVFEQRGDRDPKVLDVIVIARKSTLNNYRCPLSLQRWRRLSVASENVKKIRSTCPAPQHMSLVQYEG